MSWESPGGPVTGYVIYYQSKRGAVSSDMVSGRENHLLDGLQRGVTYNISIVALSQHLPSLLVGPVTVTSGELPANRSLLTHDLEYHIPHPVLVEIETSCKSITTSPNKQFFVNCTARAEIDGQSVPLEMIIEWTRTNLCLLSLTDSSDSDPALTKNYQEQNAVECRGNSTLSPVISYQGILTATENDTDIIIYQCTARLLNNLIFTESVIQLLSQYLLKVATSHYAREDASIFTLLQKWRVFLVLEVVTLLTV